MSHSVRALENRRIRARERQKVNNILRNSGRSHLKQLSLIGDEKSINRFFVRLMSAGRLLRRKWAWVRRLEK
jgi:hypothetical protein